MRWSPIDKARLALPLSVAALGVAGVMAPPAVAASDPPPGRAYELVSVVNDPLGAMAGLSTDLYPMPGRSSEDGDAVIYGAGSSLGPNWSGPANVFVFGRRTATGWQARTASRSADQGDTALELLAHEARGGWLSSDGREFLYAVSKPIGNGGTGVAAPGIYSAMDAATPPTWLSQPEAGLPFVSGVDVTNLSVGGDNRSVVFQSTVPLTADAPPAGTRGIYVHRDGALKLVSRLPDGSVASNFTYLANSPSARTQASTPARVLRNQIAGDGRYVLFVGSAVANGAPNHYGPLYVRDLEQDVTRQLAGGGTGAPDIAASLRTAWGSSSDIDPLTVPAGMVFGARDAGRAFFRTQGSSFLYDANLETGEVTARPALTGPPLSLSRDGERMLFLTPPTGGGHIGDWTLRYWDADQPDTSVAVGTVPVASTVQPYGFAQGYEPSADGESWVFAAQGSLDPARPNATPGIRQLYVWSVGDSTATCLTCQPTDGIARTSGPNLSTQENVSTEYYLEPTTAMPTGFNPSKLGIAQTSHSFSEDGRWLLFDSPDRLVAEDTNDVRDVYLWDRDGGPGGQLQLVTRGVGSSPAYAVDLDPTGRNAFFTTRDALVPKDADGAYDVYTARIGGGFPEDSPESCAGEACRPSVGTPVGPAIGSVAFAGRGNASPPAGSASVRVSGLKAVTGSAARIRVRVPGAGRVSVAGASVKGAGKSAGKAGTYTVRVALKPGARKKLAKRGRLRAAVRVSYRADSGRRVSRTVRITFKAPKQPGNAGRKGGR